LQEEFADAAGLNRNYIGMIKREEKSLTVDMIEKRAAALDTVPLPCSSAR